MLVALSDAGRRLLSLTHSRVCLADLGATVPLTHTAVRACAGGAVRRREAAAVTRPDGARANTGRTPERRVDGGAVCHGAGVAQLLRHAALQPVQPGLPQVRSLRLPT